MAGELRTDARVATDPCEQRSPARFARTSATLDRQIDRLLFNVVALSRSLATVAIFRQDLLALPADRTLASAGVDGTTKDSRTRRDPQAGQRNRS